MKITRKLVVALSVLLVFTTVLAGCSKRGKFESGDNGIYRDKKTSVSYKDAPACYEAYERSDELYGSGKGVSFYTIVGLDPLEWLCEESGTVFYSENTKLPTLSEMDISSVGIYWETSEILKLADVTDENMIAGLKGSYVSGISLTYLPDTPTINWKIKFCDTSLGLCYTVTYLEYAEDYIVTGEDGEQINCGRKFFRNRYEGKFVPAGDWLDSYVREFNGITEG